MQNSEFENDAILLALDIYNDLTTTIYKNRAAKTPKSLNIAGVNVLRGVYDAVFNGHSITLLGFDETCKGFIFVGVKPSEETVELLSELEANLIFIPMKYDYETMFKKYTKGNIECEMLKPEEDLFNCAAKVESIELFNF